jgi:methylmalonyl-CoA epimerase
MKINRISHIAVYGRDMDRLKHLFSALLGLDVTHEEVIDDIADLCFLPVGDTEVELVAPTSKGNSFDRHLDDGKLGIDHIAFEVEDIEAAVGEMTEKGLVDDDVQIKPGAQGSRIAFLSLARTDGISIELVEPAAPPMGSA